MKMETILRTLRNRELTAAKNRLMLIFQIVSLALNNGKEPDPGCLEHAFTAFEKKFGEVNTRTVDYFYGELGISEVNIPEDLLEKFEF